MAIYSAKHNYLFLANPQTGSKAIAKTLLEQLDGEQIPAKDIKRDGKVVVDKHHTTIKKLIKFELLTEDQVQRAFKFCGVRNPFDMLVSRYFKLRGRFSDSGAKAGFIQRNPHRREAQELASTLEFPEWLAQAHREFIANDRPVMGPMMFLDRVDLVIRFESLAEGFKEALQHIGTSDQIQLPAHNVTTERMDGEKKRDFRDFYDPASIALVNKLYGPLIERFGYTCDRS